MIRGFCGALMVTWDPGFPASHQSSRGCSPRLPGHGEAPVIKALLQAGCGGRYLPPVPQGNFPQVVTSCPTGEGSATPTQGRLEIVLFAACGHVSRQPSGMLGGAGSVGAAVARLRCPGPVFRCCICLRKWLLWFEMWVMIFFITGKYTYVLL